MEWLGAIFKFLTAVMARFFPPKSPEEKERDRISDEKEERREGINDVRDAFRKAKDSKGDTSAIEDLLNK